MNKLAISVIGLCLLSVALAAPADTDSNRLEKKTIDNDENLDSDDAGYSGIEINQPAQNIIAAIYRRATVQALQTKVHELQYKILKGENPLPTAVEVMKIAMFSNPTHQTIKKVAEHVLALMSPEVRKLAPEALLETEEMTTPMPKKMEKEPTLKKATELKEPVKQVVKQADKPKNKLPKEQAPALKEQSPVLKEQAPKEQAPALKEQSPAVVEQSPKKEEPASQWFDLLF